MDRDEFTRASRLARRAAESVCAAVRGEPFDLIFVARRLDCVFESAGGIASIGQLFSLLADTRREPLFAFAAPKNLADMGARLHATASGVLDLDLALCARRYAMRGGKDAYDLARMFVRRIIDREIIDSRGGVIEHLDAEEMHAAHDTITDTLAPLIDRAARLLVANPLRKRLGLGAFLSGSLDVEDDLLGS